MRARAALGLLLLLPGLAFASDLDDPFPFRDPFPLRLLFLDASPVAATLQPPLRERLSVSTSYVNTMVATDDLVKLYEQNSALGGRVTLGALQAVAAAQPSGTAFILDGESLRTTLQARFGVTRRLEVGVEVPFVYMSSGFLDHYIDGFHKHLSLPDGGRPAFAEDQFRAGYVGDGAVVYFDQAPGGPHLGDIVVSATTPVFPGSRSAPAVSFTLSVKLPTGDYQDLSGSGSLDYGGTLRASHRWGRSAAHAGLAFNSVGEWKLAPSLPLHNSRSLFATYAYALTPKTCAIFQGLRVSGPFPFRSGNDLGKVAMEVAAGFRHRTRTGVELEWSVIENIDPFYNTPDVGIYLGFVYHTREPTGSAPDRSPKSPSTP